MMLRFQKIVPLTLLIILLQQGAGAQCPDISLNSLQIIQNAAPDQKESKILGEGFDLRQSVTRNSGVTHVYTKCWVTSEGQKDFYRQKLFWNLGDDTIKLALMDEKQFQSIRQALDERHPAGAGATVVVGKMYKYFLGSEKIDGMDYYTVTVGKK
jgi:hypothetical protein